MYVSTCSTAVSVPARSCPPSSLLLLLLVSKLSPLLRRCFPRCRTNSTKLRSCKQSINQSINHASKEAIFQSINKSINKFLDQSSIYLSYSSSLSPSLPPSPCSYWPAGILRWPPAWGRPPQGARDRWGRGGRTQCLQGPRRYCWTV